MKLWGKSRFRGGKIRRKWLAEQIANGRLVMAVGHCADIALTIDGDMAGEATVKSYTSPIGHELMARVEVAKAVIRWSDVDHVAIMVNTFTPPDDVERLDLGRLVEK